MDDELLEILRMLDDDDLRELADAIAAEDRRRFYRQSLNIVVTKRLLGII